MGITLPYTFVSGAARTGAEVQANLEAVRKYINGRIVQTDVPVDTVNYRHIQRPEHFGRPTITTQAVFSDVYGRSATASKSERACMHYAMSGLEYEMCPELSATITIERTSWVKVRARFYAWGVGPASAIVTPAASNQVFANFAFAKLYIDETPKTSTIRRISMHDYLQWGVWPCDKKEYSFIYAEQLAAGRYDITTKFKLTYIGTTSLVSPIDDSATVAISATSGGMRNLFIEARSFTVEVDTIF